MEITKKQKERRLKIPAVRVIEIWWDSSVINNIENSFIKIDKETLTFKNVEVQGEIDIESSKEFPNLEFINCEIEQFFISSSSLSSICFKNSKVDLLSFEDSEIKVFRINNSQFIEIFIHDKSQIDSIGIFSSNFGKVELKGDSKIVALKCQNSNQKGDFEIEKSQITFIEISDNSELGKLKFWNYSKSQSIRIETSKLKFLDFTNSKVKALKISFSNIGGLSGLNFGTSEVDIYQSQIDNIVFVKSLIKFFGISSFSTTHKLEIYNNSKIGTLRLFNSSVKKVRVFSDTIVGRFIFSLTINQPSVISLYNSTFGKIDFFHSRLSEESTVSISNCKINEFSVLETSNLGSVFISEITPINIWEDFQKNEGIYIDNDDEFLFEKNSSKSQLRFINSDLRNFQILSTDLSKFEKFEFLNSKMLGVFSAGSEFPKSKQFMVPEHYPVNLSEQKRLAFGQIKKIYETQGDRASSLQYLALEMEAYREQLQEEGWMKNKGELFILWANKLSTNYGTSWGRGILSTLIALTFFYSIFCFLIDYRLDLSWDGLEKFGEVISYAPYYLNPLRDGDSIFILTEKEIKALDYGWLARIWDFISRVFLTYFVIQTVQAFRKLGKSSG